MPQARPLFVFVLFLTLVSGGVSHALMNGVQLRDNVGIKTVSGGDKNNPLWKSPSGNDAFRRSLKRTLDSIGMLERARGEGRYSLDAVLESCRVSAYGCLVSTHVKYTLHDNKTGNEVFQDTIASEYGDSVWDCLLRTEKSLTESSFRTNIALLADKLSRLDLLLLETSTKR